MKTFNLRQPAIVLSLLFSFSMVQAAPNVDTITVQGYMKQASGAAVTSGTYVLVYGLCKLDCSSTSNVLWVKKISTTISNGLFSANLSGSGQDLSADASVPVGSNLRLDKSAYSLNSTNIAGVATGALLVRVYAYDSIDSNNPTFDISLNSVPTSFYAGNAGSATTATTATTANAVAAGSIVAASLDNTGAQTIPSLWSLPSSQLTGALPAISGAALTNITAANVSGNISGSAASLSGGATFAAPGAIGSTTPSTGAFTTLSASSTVSGSGFSTYLASPPAIGGTAAAAGAFTTLSASSTVSGTGFSTYLASPPDIGGTAAAAGAFTTLAASSTVSGTGFSTYLASPPAIGGTAAAAGAFTTLAASSTVSGTGFSTYLASPPAIGGTAPAAGAFTTLSATGAITPSTTSGIVGTAVADSANAGSVGEVLTCTAAPATNALVTATSKNVCSVSLTAGDWDCRGVVNYSVTATTNYTRMAEGIHSATNTLGAQNTYTEDIRPATIPGAISIITRATPVVRVNIAATTTYYLVARVTFSASTVSTGGLMTCRRMR